MFKFLKSLLVGRSVQNNIPYYQDNVYNTDNEFPTVPEFSTMNVQKENDGKIYNLNLYQTEELNENGLFQASNNSKDNYEYEPDEDDSEYKGNNLIYKPNYKYDTYESNSNEDNKITGDGSYSNSSNEITDYDSCSNSSSEITDFGSYSNSGSDEYKEIDESHSYKDSEVDERDSYQSSEVDDHDSYQDSYSDKSDNCDDSEYDDEKSELDMDADNCKNEIKLDKHDQHEYFIYNDENESCYGTLKYTGSSRNQTIKISEPLQIQRNTNILINILKAFPENTNSKYINLIRSGKIYERKMLALSNIEYSSVKKKFDKCMRRGTRSIFRQYTVRKIEKIWCPYLLAQFKLKEQKKLTVEGAVFKEAMYHGTAKLQINLQASQPQHQSINDSNGTSPSFLEDDIDAALNNLQTTLEGSSIRTHINDITSVPELKDQLRFLKPKRFTLKAYKKYWFTCRDLHLYMYKNREDMVHNINCVMNINLKGCEVTPDVNISQNKYVIKLEVPSTDGMAEMYIRCDDETQYSRWMACCRLAAKGRSLADSSYETEKQTILDFLNLQRRAEEPVINPSSLDIQVEDYIGPKYLKKLRGKITQRILEAHTNVKDLSLVGAKLNYIKAWQLLPDFGITLFVVKFMDCKKEELLGVAYNRIMKMDINSGDHQKTWRFNTMKAWNVNWEIKHMMVQFEEGNIVFSSLSADCKVVHEFIGGYIFLSTRSKDASQTLNEELFHKLTGGWS